MMSHSSDNCIILGRAEMFANKNTVIASAADAVGMGIGFTLAIFVMASVREVFGSGTFFGMAIPILKDNNISILTMAPGGFFIYGCMIALVNKATKGKPIKKLGCAGCPSTGLCGKLYCENQGALEA